MIQCGHFEDQGHFLSVLVGCIKYLHVNMQDLATGRFMVSFSGQSSNGHVMFTKAVVVVLT